MEKCNKYNLAFFQARRLRFAFPSSRLSYTQKQYIYIAGHELTDDYNSKRGKSSMNKILNVYLM